MVGVYIYGLLYWEEVGGAGIGNKPGRTGWRVEKERKEKNGPKIKA